MFMNPRQHVHIWTCEFQSESGKLFVIESTWQLMYTQSVYSQWQVLCVYLGIHLRLEFLIELLFKAKLQFRLV